MAAEPGAQAANREPDAYVFDAERERVRALDQALSQRGMLRPEERNQLIDLINRGNRQAAEVAKSVAGRLTGVYDRKIEGISYMFQIIDAAIQFLPHNAPYPRGLDGGRRRTRRSRRSRRHRRK